MANSKETLRHDARRKRAAQGANPSLFTAACDLFFAHVNPISSAIIAGYWPSGSEFDVTPLMEEALHRGVLCCMPVIPEEGRVLNFREWTRDTKLREGLHGVFYPESGELLVPDIVIVPLLAFDQTGTRLGQGGGYYDATLADLRAKKEMLAIGLAYEEQACLFDLPFEGHDQRLDMAVTPERVYDFRK